MVHFYAANGELRDRQPLADNHHPGGTEPPEPANRSLFKLPCPLLTC
jgi:hypothetical protein